MTDKALLETAMRNVEMGADGLETPEERKVLALSQALLEAVSENPMDCGKDHIHPCGEGSGGPACRKHLVLWNLEKEMRVDEVEAELVKLRADLAKMSHRYTIAADAFHALKEKVSAVWDSLERDMRENGTQTINMQFLLQFIRDMTNEPMGASP